jgi:hypothetical protein
MHSFQNFATEPMILITRILAQEILIIILMQAEAVPILFGSTLPLKEYI